MSRDDPNKDCEMRDKDGERGIAAPEVKEVEKQLASEEVQYTKGVKLWIILTGVTLVFFVVLLDLAILSTVSVSASGCELCGCTLMLTSTDPGNTQDHKRFSLPHRRRLVRCSVPSR